MVPTEVEGERISYKEGGPNGYDRVAEKELKASEFMDWLRISKPRIIVVAF